MIKVQAHRGASKERPENTMSAFKHALALGADGIELDVHMLCDGTIIVRHDSDLGRCESIEGNIYNYSRESIKSFSVGSWFSEEHEKDVIPYFTEVLEFLKANNLFLNVEIKPGTPFIDNSADRVIELLDKYNMVNRCIISSFNHYILKDIKEKNPEYKVGILYSYQYKYNVVDYCKQHGFDAVHPYYKSIDKQFVDACHQNGILVNVWTVDAPEDLQRMKEYGVDTVISNDVVTAKKTLK